MSALDNLRLLASNVAANKTVNVPGYAIPRPKYTDLTSNGLTKCIIDSIRMNGYQAERISVEGRTIDTRKTYIDVSGRRKTIGNVKRIKASSQIGSADISATINGKSVKIEVKIGRDRQSDEQKLYQESVERAGGIYLIARDFQQFYDWFESIKKG